MDLTNQKTKTISLCHKNYFNSQRLGRPNLANSLHDQRKVPSIVSRLQCNVGKMNLSSNFSMVPVEVRSNDMEEDFGGIMANEHSIVMTAVCGIIALFSFIGNLLLCIVILKRRSMLTKPYNVLIFNLAVTDMLTGETYYHLVDYNFTFKVIFRPLSRINIKLRSYIHNKAVNHCSPASCTHWSMESF